MDPQEIPLRGLHLPETVGWWPLAPGWWALSIVAVIAAGWLMRLWLRRRAHAAARRKALRQLEKSRLAYADHGNPVTLGAEISQLLRRAMLAYAPRADVAERDRGPLERRREPGHQLQRHGGSEHRLRRIQ